MFAAAYSFDDLMILQAIWGKGISGFDSEETKINFFQYQWLLSFSNL